MQHGIKRNIFVAATYAGVLLVGLLLGQKYGDEQGNNQGTSILSGGLTGNSEKVQYLVNLISDNYVDKVNLDTIQDEAIQHIITRLDPFSTFMKPNERLAQTEALEGTFDGIGVEYFNLNDTLLVIGVITGGPAEKAGMKVGDRMLQISKKNIAGIKVSEQEIEKLIRGKKGSTVSIVIKRNNEILTTPLKVIRDQVNVSTLDVAYMIAPKTAYVKIRRFGHQTAEDFKVSLRNLKKTGAQDLILDLRGNGGGYLHAAIDLASMFFKDKRLLMYTEGANELRRDYFSKEGGDFSQGRIVILINEGTASASEIVTGSLQDLDRALIVGRRSYGKGLVQEQFDFADGSAVSLTVARYYTPLGRCIQRRYTRSNEDQHKYLTTFDQWKLDTEFKTNEMYTTSKGKILFGGGGIKPDVEIPIDSNEISAKYREIYHSNILEEFVYSRFTKKLPAYSIENFLSGYHLPDAEYNAFIAFLKSKAIAISIGEEVGLHQIVQSDMEALVGRYYFGREAYYKIKNRKDSFIAKACAELGANLPIN